MYHVNPETGNPGVCRAKKKCRFGDLQDEHYPTRELAAEAFEQKMILKELVDEEARLATLRKEVSQQMNDAWVKVGRQWERRATAEEWEELENRLYALDAPQRKARQAIREKMPLEPWDKEFPQALGLATAKVEAMEMMNIVPPSFHKGRERDDYYFVKDMAANIDETLARYQAGETIEETGWAVAPDDRLLATLTNEQMTITSTGAVYSVLVFPEKDLKPVLERLGVENVSVSPFNNTREWGLVYTVMTPAGTRSFNVYEHRNTDSIIINGEENWDRDERPYGPYGDGDRGKNGFFAEFHADDKRQQAETLGYFLKEAQKGTLESDKQLAAKAEHRDWTAILSEQIPGFAEWAEENGMGKKKRGFED